MCSPHLRKRGPKGKASKGAFLGDNKIRCGGLIRKGGALHPVVEGNGTTLERRCWLRGPVDGASRMATVATVIMSSPRV